MSAMTSRPRNDSTMPEGEVDDDPTAEQTGGHRPLISTGVPLIDTRPPSAEDAVGTEDQDQDQDREGDHVLELVGEGTPNPVRNRFGPTCSSTPRRRPPSMAPMMLPMPPRTAAVKALMPGRKPMKQWTWLKSRS